MAENLDTILEILRKNGLSKAEAALRSELADKRKKLEKNELTVKEIEVEKIRKKPEDVDLYPWNFNPTYDTKSVGTAGKLSQLLMSENPSAWGDSASSSSYESKNDGKKKGERKFENCGGFDVTRLHQVKLKSEETLANSYWEEKGAKISNEESNFLMGSLLDVPVGREIHSSGTKRTVGSSWLSVSQGIADNTSDLISSLATFGDGSADYLNEYWDSDKYDDDDDVGYRRQPIENEAWFLAHEISYPSDDEKRTRHGNVPSQQYDAHSKDEDANHFLTEEDSFFSGEQHIQAKNMDVVASRGPLVHSVSEMYDNTDKNELIALYDGYVMNTGERNLMNAGPVWQGFTSQSNELIMSENGDVLNEYERNQPKDICVCSALDTSVRSIGVDINGDLIDSRPGMTASQHNKSKSHSDRSDSDKKMKVKLEHEKYVMAHESDAYSQKLSYNDCEFSFGPPSRTGDREEKESGRSLWSDKGEVPVDDDTDHYINGISMDNKLATWRQKINESTPVKSSRNESTTDAVRSGDSSASVSDNGFSKIEATKNDQDFKAHHARQLDINATLEDEEVAAVREQLRQIKIQEEQFETFNLKIVHRKNRTGFEGDKNFHIVLNSVIAGRYHVTEYLGSAAFSKAVQAHDLQTGMDVCIKIIKNNKDFFDQSLDEIKLLKFVNKNDPADKYHILRLYDYFYFREHLLIICELLKANLYEFHKFNRESGGEVYFTMPRLQSITIQCLEALQFLHGLGLIHCDLKPENILVKSYSCCEVKVIDFGSSCFETDHLCSYVQSRSYRAPEVILGLPYDKKIDLWSLGCILAELCTGIVLFQNDSPTTLLARVIGIIGSIDEDMLAKGRDTHKYFSKNYMLYEKNQETNRLEYLIPKKTSLRHRLRMGDQGFIDLIAHLLEINPMKRLSASDALKHPWLSYPYEPISS